MGASTSNANNCCCVGSRGDERGNFGHDEPFLPVTGKFKELMASDSYGCVIERTEERGITMEQLKKLTSYVDNHCEAERWTSAQHVLLNPSMVNIYDVVNWIVKPATEARRCSFVELVAPRVQVPKWFVSHWWGESLKISVKALSQHCLDRSLTLDCPYWVCAYANNQRELAGDVNVDPMVSSFRKAIQLAQGTVTLLDKKSIAFSRVWCAYESFISLVSHGKSTYLHDVYTADEHHAVGLIDRSAGMDVDKSEYWFMGDRYAQEKDFPLYLAEAALKVKVQAAEASRQADKRHILNAIVSRKELDMEPLAEHANYEAVNRLLRGRFAASTWLQAFENGRPMQAYNEALRNSGLQDFSASIDCSFFDQAALRLLLDSVPLTVRTLELRFYEKHLKAASTLIWRDALPMLQHITTLTLDLCLNSLGDTGILGLAVAINSLKSLTGLTLYLSENGISDAGIKWFSEAFRCSTTLTRLRLYFRKNRIGDEGIEKLAGVLTGCLQLTSLTLNLKENRFSPIAVHILAKALKNQQLIRLELKLAHNHFGFEEAITLGECLKSLLLLTHLALDFKNLRLEEGGAVLAEAVGGLSQLTGLRLHLLGNNIGEGSATLGMRLTHLLQLSTLEIELDMKDGSDGPDLLGPLSMAVSSLPRLRRFTLRLHDPLGTKLALHLADELKSFTQLTHLNLELQMSGATGIGKSLWELSDLTSLHLQIREESHGDTVVVAMADVLEGLTRLSSFELDLSVGSLDDESLWVLGDTLKTVSPHIHTDVRVHDRQLDNLWIWNIWHQCLEFRKGFASLYQQDVQFVPYWIT